MEINQFSTLKTYVSAQNFLMRQKISANFLQIQKCIPFICDLCIHQLVWFIEFFKIVIRVKTMNSSKFNATSSKLSRTLEKLDEVNKAALLQEKIDENQILLTVLSTTLMMAKKQKASKEHYQWTRSYLQHIADEKGRQLPNMQWLVQRLNQTEQDFHIDDELSHETVPGAFENPLINISIDEYQSGNETIPSTFIAGQISGSTPHPNRKLSSTTKTSNQPGVSGVITHVSILEP